MVYAISLKLVTAMLSVLLVKAKWDNRIDKTEVILLSIFVNPECKQKYETYDYLSYFGRSFIF